MREQTIAMELFAPSGYDFLEYRGRTWRIRDDRFSAFVRAIAMISEEMSPLNRSHQHHLSMLWYAFSAFLSPDPPPLVKMRDHKCEMCLDYLKFMQTEHRRDGVVLHAPADGWDSFFVLEKPVQGKIPKLFVLSN